MSIENRNDGWVRGTADEFLGQDGLTFGELNRANAARHAEPSEGSEETWTLPEWTNALAGEAGELANLAKKVRRGLPTDPTLEEARIKIGHELADIVTYADLIAQKVGVDLGAMIREKFNIVSDRRNSKYRL